MTEASQAARARSPPVDVDNRLPTLAAAVAVALAGLAAVAADSAAAFACPVVVARAADLAIAARLWFLPSDSAAQGSQVLLQNRSYSAEH